jgi:enoyl-CoA hydratase
VANQKVAYELRDHVALIVMDDGKVNALSHEMLAALHAALDRAQEAQAVVLAGRPGRLSGGFDLRTMTSSPDAARALVTAGAELLLRCYTFPRPLVVACTGHAIAAGAILLLAADVRVGAEGDFKIGLNEVAIQLTLPIFALEMARDRLSKRHFTAAVTQARMYDPLGAQDAGYLDEIVPAAAAIETALAHARRLAALPDPAFGATKQRERTATVRLIRDTLAADIAQLTSVPGS